MGEHADDEPELGPSRADIRIASVSLGAPRRFVIRHRIRKDKLGLFRSTLAEEPVIEL